jgi:hypothetical protein
LVEQIPNGDPALSRVVLPLRDCETYWFVKFKHPSTDGCECPQCAKTLGDTKDILRLIRRSVGSVPFKLQPAVLPNQERALAVPRRISGGIFRVCQSPNAETNQHHPKSPISYRSEVTDSLSLHMLERLIAQRVFTSLGIASSDFAGRTDSLSTISRLLLVLPGAILRYT